MLVCYATAAGSTRGIAERIADRIRSDLRAAGHASEVPCWPAGADLDADGFDVLVLGSAVHDMAWLPDATAFLERAAGTGTPAYVFSVGSVEPGGFLTRLLVARERTTIERAFPPGFTPRDHAVFRGVVVTTGVPLWGRVFWRLIGGRPGDHRNWPAVEAWADGIATAVVTAGGVAPGRRRT